ncbi:MAG TPA: organic hydroperoxide resistance protein [Acidimicrobiales bacterium]
MDVLYTAEATAWGGREGRAASSDGNLDVQLVVPKELGGPGGTGTNPEQLFAAGYAGCFHSALKLIARRAGLDVSESAITARVGIGANESGGFGLAVELTAELPGLSAEQGNDLLARAHQVCPYSNATRGNVEVALRLHEDD